MNKVILITGTSSGFGKFTAQTLAQNGHTVYASMRRLNTKNASNAAQLKVWAARYNYNLKLIDLDITNIKSVEKAVEEIHSNEGRIDVLVNNAGHGSMGLTEDFTPELVKKQFDTSVFGLFNVTRTVIPKMRQQKSGLIITISSGLGRIIIPTLTIYGASKFAEEALAEGWRYELAPLGIDSVIVEPGQFPTTNFLASAYANSPQPSDKIEEYGNLKFFIDGFAQNISESIKNSTASNPQEVADAVNNLVNMEFGNRPLRTVVDNMNAEGMNALNRMTDEMQARLLNALHLEPAKSN